MSERGNYKSMYRDNITHNRDLTLKGEVNSDNKRPTWTAYLTGNRARITVWLSNANNDSIKADLSLMTWNLFMKYIEEIASNPEMGSRCIELKGYGRGGYKEGLITHGKLYVGRDTSGLIFVSLTQGNKDRVKFVFKDEYQFFRITHSSGEEVSASEISEMIAKAYAKTGRDLFNGTAVFEYPTNPVKDKGEKQNKGRNDNQGNYKQNNGNNNHQSSDDFGDDDWG